MFMILYLWLCSSDVLRNLRICILSLPIRSLKNSNHPFHVNKHLQRTWRTNSFPGQGKSTTFLVWMGPLAIAWCCQVWILETSQQRSKKKPLASLNTCSAFNLSFYWKKNYFQYKWILMIFSHSGRINRFLFSLFFTSPSLRNLASISVMECQVDFFH